ncbi:anti-repressor SinI family protein [Niallia sp.]|nr:anti-repressor SinI family protein [Niallia sp.]
MINLFPTDLLTKSNLDIEWIMLIMEAKKQGFTQEEVRAVLTILKDSY